MKRWCGLLVLVLLMIPSVSAIGLSPVKFEVLFEPFLTQNFSITVINSDTRPINATLKFSGDLAEYIEYTPGTYLMDAHSTKKIPFTLSLPQDITPPGKHRISIIAEELAPQDAQISVGTTTIVKMEVFVPFPGKYLAFSFTTPHVNEGEFLIAEFSFSNLGKESLRNVFAHVDVTDEKGTIIATEETFPLFLGADQRTDTTLIIDKGTFPPGTYNLTAFVSYDSVTTPLQSALVNVGTLFINLTNYTRVLTPEAINKFDVSIASKWNNNIDEVYADVALTQDNHPIAGPFKTLSASIAPWQELHLSAFVDTTGIPLGSYQAEITLYYEDKETVFIAPIWIQKQKTPLSPTTKLFIIAIILLILINIYTRISKKGKEKRALFKLKKHLDNALDGDDAL